MIENIAELYFLSFFLLIREFLDSLDTSSNPKQQELTILSIVTEIY